MLKLWGWGLHRCFPSSSTSVQDMDDQETLSKLQLADDHGEISLPAETLESLSQPRLPDEGLEEAVMSCPICGAPSRNRFCSAHQMAFQNLLSVYEVWRRALEISWRDYLERVAGNENSGRWVQEVCAFLLLNDGVEMEKA